LALFKSSGEFPSELFELSDSLESLDISNSYIVGTLPSLIGTLTNLKRLSATSNDFHGTIPSEIGQLSILEEFDLSENLLSGPLPNKELSSMTRLRNLSLSRKAKSGRKLSGPLPSWETSMLAIEMIQLDGNELTGTIPENFLASSSRVQSVNISGNRFTGALPSTLPFVLYAGNVSDKLIQEPNVDEGQVLTEIFELCGGAKWLRRDYWMSKVDFCSWHGVGCSDDGRVILLNLQSNNLVGVMPKSVFNLPRLEILWLSKNPALEVTFENVTFSGVLRDLGLASTTLPSLRGLGRAKSLTSVDASNCSLGGTFPLEILELENLRKLSLSDNALEGSFPPSLASLPYLRILDAENNQFSGSLPSFRDSITLRLIRLGYNKFQGNIPDIFLERVPSFAAPKIFLAGNQLTGPLPQDWKRLENLTLDIRDNLIDAIPNVFCLKAGWNDGAVGRYGCGALACPPGKANRHGRQSPEYPICVTCPAAKRFFGQTDCAADHVSHHVVFKFCLSLLLFMSLGLVALVGLFYLRKRRRGDDRVYDESID
jgi:Leucine-rich repeat (LRR) protein